jgi:predicted house-cleaning noncanonical NTP pyrophosphatase (MazG superfamily)
VTTYRKLVRDRVPEIIEAAGVRPITRRLERNERLPALFAKLHEESDEVASAAGIEHQCEELADLYEVLLGIASELGIPWQNVTRTASEKRELRGAFEQWVWLESTEPRN